MPDSLALTDGKGRQLKVAGRYKGVSSRRFKDLCAESDKGDKYNLADEISVIRGMLASIVSKLEPDEDELLTDSLYLYLTREDQYSKPQASHIVRCVDTFGSAREITTVSKEVRELLKQAAEFEMMMPIEKVRAFIAEVFRIIRHEVKDESLVESIGRQVQALRL